MRKLFRNVPGRRRMHMLVALAVCLTAALVCAAAAITVFAQERPATVADWDETYSFQLSGSNPDAMLSRAQELGMAPLGPLDITEFSQESSTVTVRRGVELLVTDQGETTTYTAYKGDTVEQALLDQGLALKEDDQVTPHRGTPIAASMTVEIKRVCRVNITADGETRQVKLTEGTAADALAAAGVELGKNDTCSHELTEAITDDMHLVVSRITSINITTEGKTKRYQVAAATVGEALEKCKLEPGEEDRLNVALDAPLTENMRIILQRVKTVEETETQEINYETKYISTRDLPEGETNLLTPGLKGKKELVYKAVYVDGQLESREKLSEKVKAEPVKEIVLRGSGYQTVAPQLEFEEDEDAGSAQSSGSAGESQNKAGISVNTTAGTLTDQEGKTVKYTKAITGSCTAYCIPGGTTSVGLVAQRGVIAVDPDIIPYGTKMFVASPDGEIVYGYGVAGDTGGACLDGDIVADLCYDTLEECSIIGRRDMVLYILE